MYKVTALSKPVRRLDLAKWIYSLRWLDNVGGKSTSIVMDHADVILGGGAHEWNLTVNEVVAGYQLCNIVEITEPAEEHPYTAHFKKQAEYSALRDRGAAGDAEAAIAYCKLEAEGLVSHAAFG